MYFPKPGLALVLLWLCGYATAQAQHAARKLPTSSPATGWKLVSLSVKGTERYGNQEVLDAIGLQVGQSVNEADFRKVTDQLGQTGLFSSASYAYSYSPAGAKLELQLSDNDQLVPAKFDNFVWMTDQELFAKLRERVPLFKGLLPVAGELADQVSDALQALLIEHKVQGKVDYTRLAALNGPLNAFLYTVSGHSVRIHNLAFTDAGAAELPLLQNAAKRLFNTEYAHTTVEEEERIGFRPIYLRSGHLKASFDETQVKIAHESEEETSVDVTVHVMPGLQYKFADITWVGNSAFPSPQLQSLIQLKPGQPADALELDKDLRGVAELYGTKGYMAAGVNAKPGLDDAAATVHYDLEVHEGDVYKMGELEIRGLDEKSRNKMVFDWKLLEGQVYDSSYFQRFHVESAKDLPPGIKWTVDEHVAVNEDKTVDVTLRYETKP